MINDPDEIRAQVAELLGEHTEPCESDLDATAARLEEAIVSINRDVVDAKRQFELG